MVGVGVDVVVFVVVFVVVVRVVFVVVVVVVVHVGGVLVGLDPLPPDPLLRTSLCSTAPPPDPPPDSPKFRYFFPSAAPIFALYLSHCVSSC